MMKPTSVLILSDKSSGSTVLQRELARHPLVHTMRRAPNQEGETLYWSKAAALLDLPQPQMMDSVLLPMAPATARDELGSLIASNLDEPWPTPGTKEDIFALWQEFTAAYGPVFLEKSPHHLHNRAVLELLLEARTELPEIEFRFIGLVRNPVDTLYSMWNRWRTVPEVRAAEWRRTYENLLWLAATAPDVTRIVRYEDLVADPSVMPDLLAFVGVPREEDVGKELHVRSVQSWRNDRSFGYQPDPDTRRLAAEFGYSESDLANVSSVLWPMYREGRSLVRRLRVQAGRWWHRFRR